MMLSSHKILDAFVQEISNYGKNMKLVTNGKQWIWYHCPCPVCPCVNTTKNLVMCNHYSYNWIATNGHMQL